MSMMSKTPDAASPREVLAWEEFIEVTGISPEQLHEIVALGWINAASEEPQTFSNADIYRVRKLERICCDFELPVIGGTIIVDLLQRIDRLERLVAELNDLNR